ncbi:MAG: hypothetical protein LUG57_03425 [Oscillospiraceae bacterium]|nr:hypothetical protein [Oscillospiraceae bacterium]
MKRPWRWILAALLLLLLPGCTLGEAAAGIGSAADALFTAAAALTETAAASPLSAEELYEQVLTGLENYETEIVLDNCEGEAAAAAYKQVVAEHPELFWVSDGYWWSSVTKGGETTVTLTPGASGETAAQIRGKQATLEAVTEAIVSQLGEATDYEKALFIHDYLVAAVDYDQQEAALIASDYYQDTIPDCATAYGALVNGSAVCSGYARAFQLLAQRLGLTCVRVSGQGLEGGAHEWNAVVMDGEWYYVDVTWDDPVYAGLSTSVVSHEFFGVTTAELLLTHTIQDEQSAPDCTAVTYDYFRWNGLYFEDYDLAALAALNLGDAFQIKFADSEALNQAVEDLFSGQGVFELAPSWASSVQYAQGTSGLVLTVEFS